MEIKISDMTKTKLSKRDKYSIEQFPKNKTIDNLSPEQLFVRANLKPGNVQKTKICNRCGKEQPVLEFYIKDKKTKRHDNTCRDCRIKQAGCLEVGKQRFAYKILKKGFRRCSVCKEIKPLTMFTKSVSGYLGYANNCYPCSKKLLNLYQKDQSKSIGQFFIRQYALKTYGIKINTDEEYARYKLEIEENRKPKFYLDGKSFLFAHDFALYMKQTYGFPVTTTLARLTNGKTTEECKISEFDLRSIATSKGKIKVTDVITNEVFWFLNSSDPQLFKMFGSSTILLGIKSGKPTRITSLSKYKNPCIIARITE
jgi:hypothetical protein